ncbi:MAG: single-stranded-DNA-specific exonuclease RecJ [Firmicutes bacterium HGW-Firmicutes-12]|jgi:single-stranded-DNA-specific exonuclease|nr:MAG: single-stranded-DNA-specific exonuclease RecJ [Firmicutes bacterium HGW-Firmicutes-12]
MRDKKIWQIGATDTAADYLSKEVGISSVLARVLHNRGIRSTAEAKSYLYTSVDNLTDPLDLPGMREGTQRLYDAINNGESILIYGDYDVDGITSTAMLVGLFRRWGAKVSYYIPERLEEGYGLNKQAIFKAKQQGVNILLTVDCGISSREEVSYASELGLEVIITDHHQPPIELPIAVAIINPKLVAQDVPWYDLAGVGVAFKLAQAIAEMFGNKKWCNDYLDLVALGTIADIVPLQYENRILVKEGLRLLNEIARPGLKALLEVSGDKEREVDSQQIGYYLAPRLNACGRLGRAEKAVELLLTEDSECARIEAHAMDQENKTRQELEARILEEALGLLEEQVDISKDKVIVLVAENWHPGVIGIVASRIVDRYYRPTIIISLENGTGKGSGRSIPGFSLYEALKLNTDKLIGFGGHNMAAGLSIKEKMIPLLREALNLYADKILQEQDLVPVLKADCEVSWHELSTELVEEIALMAPFGYHNPYPLLVLRSKQIQNCKEVGSNGKHLKLRVQGENGWLDGIAFQKGVYKDLVAASNRCDLAVVPEINTYQGHSKLQLVIKDMKTCQERDNPFLPLSFLDRLYLDGEIWLEDECYRDIINREEFFTKVVGVTFSDRQSIITQIQDGDNVNLTREKENEHDSYALAVYWQGCSIGYINARLARVVSPLIDMGVEYEAYITQVTGRERDSLGVNLCIRKKETNIVSSDKENIKMGLKELPIEEIEERIRQAILGDFEYHEKQKEALANLKAGQNSLAIFATGRGKSAIFQSMSAYLSLCRDQITIIVYPLRSLVNDQLQRLRQRMKPIGINVESITGSMNVEEKKEFFIQLMQGKIDVILTTPEFLAFHVEKFGSISNRLGLFVVDEAHHLAKGKRRGYRQLARSWNTLGRPLALAVTATANEETAQKIIDTILCESVVIEEHVRQNLKLIDRRREADKLAYLIRLIAAGERVVVYVNSRKQAFQLASDLRSYYPPVREEIAFYHGGLHSQYRKSLEEMFRGGDLRVMVTTSAFGEGIDIPDIKHVVLYHLSFSRTEFNQLSGRAGRNNEEAFIHILFGEKDKTLNELILEGTVPSREVLGKVYLFIRDQIKDTITLPITNSEISEAMQKAGIKNFREQTASASLAILEEMGLVLREVEGNKRFIHFVPPPPGKLDLTDSVRYIEGLDEWDEFVDFAGSVLTEAEDDILAQINQPIYPKKALKFQVK